MKARLAGTGPLIVLLSCAQGAAPTGTGPPAAPPAQDSPALADAVSRLGRAYQTADVTVLEQLIAPDYLHTNGGAAPIGRDEWLAWNRLRAERQASGAWATSTYEVSELVYAEHGDSAVVGGRVRSSGLRDGAPWQVDLRFTSFWVRRDGSWRRAGFQDAPIAP